MKEISIKSTGVIIDSKEINDFKVEIQNPVLENLTCISSSSWYELQTGYEFDFIIDGREYQALLIKSGSISEPTEFWVDIENDKELKNLRKPTYVEPKFKIMIIDFYNSMIYHSGVWKDFIKQYLFIKTCVNKSKMDFRTEIDLESFLRGIHSVKSLSFSLSDRNLFSGENALYKELTYDDYDYGIENISMKIKLSGDKNTKELVKKVASEISEVSSADAKSIKVVGKKENEMERVFKMDSFHKQILIEFDNVTEPSKGELRSMVENIVNRIRKD